MLFDEDSLIKDGKEIIIKIESNLRETKIEYNKTLKDYEKLKNGNKDVYEELEPRYLNLLAKLKRTIDETSELWDRSIENVEKLRLKKEEKAEYFLTGIVWAALKLKTGEKVRNDLIDEAKKLL